MRGGARVGAGRKRSLYDEKRVISLRKQGFTYQEIADRFNVTKSAISYFFKTHAKKYEA